MKKSIGDIGAESYSYQELVEYFEILVDMEKNRFMQKQLIDSLVNRIQSLCVPATLGPKEYICEPEVSGKELLSHLGQGAIIGVVLFLVTGVLLDELFNIYLPINILTIILFIIGTITVCCGKVIQKNTKQVQIVRVKNKEMEKEYEEKQKKDFERVKSEEVIREKLAQIKDRLKEKYVESGKILKKLYDLNICYPKYRDFVSVCSIYEYLKSGRCIELSGPHGAYNLFEFETRQNLIICKLDEVIKSLRKIEYNQMVLAQAINESNNKVNELTDATNKLIYGMGTVADKMGEISNSIKSLEERTAISTYVSEQAAKELEYLNRMENKIGKYDSVLFNDRY